MKCKILLPRPTFLKIEKSKGIRYYTILSIFQNTKCDIYEDDPHEHTNKRIKRLLEAAAGLKKQD